MCSKNKLVCCTVPGYYSATTTTLLPSSTNCYCHISHPLQHRVSSTLSEFSPFTPPPMMALHSFISEAEPIDISLAVQDTKPRAEKTAVLSQRLGLYEGKEPLVCRRSTVSFQSSMSLGNHQDGISRCLSAPGTLQLQQRPAYLASISRDKGTSNGLEVAKDNRDSDYVFEGGEILADEGDNFEMRSVPTRLQLASTVFPFVSLRRGNVCSTESPIVIQSLRLQPKPCKKMCCQLTENSTAPHSWWKP